MYDYAIDYNTVLDYIRFMKKCNGKVIFFPLSFIVLGCTMKKKTFFLLTHYNNAINNIQQLIYFVIFDQFYSKVLNKINCTTK